MTDDGPKAGVAVVTGASRGVGRGIAIALGSHGYTVYVTGRTQRAGESSAGRHDPRHRRGGHRGGGRAGTGGKGIAVRVDHRDDAETAALFERVRADEGRLDILVNNAALIHDELQRPVPFWEKPLAASTDLLDVGLRSSLVASYYAAPLLVETGRGLVVFTSAPGAVRYQYGAAYGAHKASLDKFAADMAVDFRPFGVAVVSIWMGAVLTERLQQIIDSGPELAYLDRHRGNAGVHRARHRRAGRRPRRRSRSAGAPSSARKWRSSTAITDAGRPPAAVGPRPDVRGSQSTTRERPHNDRRPAAAAH